MNVGRPPMTKWSAQLLDPASERRFRRYNLPLQRRTALGALVLILVANAGSFGYTALVGHAPISWAHALTQLVVAAIGAGLIVAVLRVRRPRSIYRAVVVGVLFLTAATGTLIVTGTAMGFRGSLLVVGGVVVIYLSAPLTLVGVTALGLLYSAVTIPAWLLGADAATTGDVQYVLVATALAHGLSFIEARRAQQERRVLFAQRELLHQLSTADPLTGLVNRRAFDAGLRQAWADWLGGSGALSVLMIDIDHFKLLNDTAGHAAGDRALQAVAAAIRSALPMPGCEIARYGGEEFACLLPGVDRDDAHAAAERLLAGVRAARIPMPRPAGEHVLTVSVGVAGARPGMATPNDLVDAADRQLYRAKQAGRDRVQAEPVTVVAGPEPARAAPADPPAARRAAPGTPARPGQPSRPGVLPTAGQPASAGMTLFSSRSSDRES